MSGQQPIFPAQPTMTPVMCTGNDGHRFRDNPVQAVITLTPQKDGSWKKTVSCPRRGDCFGVLGLGYCSHERS